MKYVIFLAMIVRVISLYVLAFAPRKIDAAKLLTRLGAFVKDAPPSGQYCGNDKTVGNVPSQML